MMRGTYGSLRRLTTEMSPPRARTARPLVVQVLGTVLAIGSGLPVGKEGPFVAS